MSPVKKQYTSFEQKMIDNLGKLSDSKKAADLESRYTRFRSRIFTEVTPQIPAAEPMLSDHSETHVLNVLDNAEKLIGDEISRLNSLEHYILCLSILFHDVGNVYERNKHNLAISKVYQELSKNDEYRSEQRLVQAIAGAHCGKGTDGSENTLKDLQGLAKSFAGEQINALELAAILRFADELAEGKQRTSYFALQSGLYKKNPKKIEVKEGLTFDNAEIFHNYASATELLIDKTKNQIVLQYGLKVEISDDDITIYGHNFEEFLEFIYYRIAKLNSERRYTAFYSDIIKAFRLVVVTIEFHDDETTYANITPRKIEISDLVVPGENDTDRLTHAGWEPDSWKQSLLKQAMREE
jgi:hypothetical protein